MGSYHLRIFLYLLISTFSVSVFSQESEQELIQIINKYQNENNRQQAAANLNKLAFLYWDQEQYEKAIQSFEQSLTLNKEIGNDNALKGIYSNMGMIYSDMKQPETSLVYFRKSLLISRNKNNKQDIGTNLINIAITLQTLNRNQEALENLTEALSVISELKDKKLLKTCYGILAEVYEKLGDSEQSMKYFNLYSSFQKQLQKEEVEAEKRKNQVEINKMQQTTQKAIEEKEQTKQALSVTQDSLKKSEELTAETRMKLQIKELELKQKQIELQNQQLLTLIFISGMCFVAILALIILRSYRQKKRHNLILEQRNQEIRKQNEEIQAKNHKINQSINYARNIQGALLPRIEDFKELFPESFIFFSPRDVVSGDFYWFTTLPSTVKNGRPRQLVAAVDCTGHGVPGAFMSMLGMSFLEEIVLDKMIDNPIKILENLHEMVVTYLKQEQTGNTDGMDIALCIYDEDTKQLSFAGAVNSLVFIQDGQLDILKGDFFGVGGQMKGVNRQFMLQTMNVNKPTTCYIFSDGFADQFGGEKGGKYFLKNFRDLLLEIHSEPFDQQGQILDQRLKEWHGETYPRVDDVLIIGFKIG